MDTLDLLLRPQGDGGVLVLLLGPGLQATFTVEPPVRLDQQYKAWLDRFIAHHDQGGTSLPAHVLQHYADQLREGLAQWLQSPGWAPLERALAAHPQAPIRLQIDAALPDLIKLPWESLDLDRSLWRVQQAQVQAIGGTETTTRQPRLLLLVGDEHSLDLSAEVERLERMHRSDRIALTVLRKEACSASAIRSALSQSPGWDALLFLGHSEADATSGGRLHLGDDGWIAARSLTQELQAAAANGLRLVLLNSCSGLNWAEEALQAGVSWAVCFREPVPSAAAAATFEQILIAMERSQDLVAAAGDARRALVHQGDAGAASLLSVLANTAAEPFQLPLRKRKQFLLRLQSSTRSQAVAAASLALIGLLTDLVPWNPINQGLLNQRLRLQRVYRELTHQPGPARAPLPVLLLEKRRAYPELGVLVPPETSRISRVALQQVLLLVSPERVPRIGLDAVLDEPAVEPAATVRLAALIQEQQRPQLFAGYYGASSDGPQAGAFSTPVPVLSKAGLGAYDLSVNTDPGWWSSQKQRQVPLQLKEAITERFFSHALAGADAALMPADAVIDWSLEWGSMLQRVNPAELSALDGPVLLVGTDGQISPEQPDLFDPPAAATDALEQWQLPTGSMPGAMVQGVLAQSLLLRHWLTPASALMSALAAAGLGVIAAAWIQQRSRRWLLLVITSSLFTLGAFQSAAAGRLLVPVLIPTAALFSAALSRHD